MADANDDAAPLSISLAYPDYEKHKDIFSRFLQEHMIQVAADDDEDSMDDDFVPSARGGARRLQPCYTQLMQDIKDRRFPDENNRVFQIQVPLDELSRWNAGEGRMLADAAAGNTLRYQSLFCEVIDRVLEALPATREPDVDDLDAMDLLYRQRVHIVQQNQHHQQHPTIQNQYAAQDNTNLEEDVEQQEQRDGPIEEFPEELNRRYELFILPAGRPGDKAPFDKQVLDGQVEKPEAGSIRNLRSYQMGKIVSCQGMVVRASDVKPRVQVATYSCDNCGIELYQVLKQNREFLPARVCPKCKKETVHLQSRGSKFCKYQELKLQELPNQVPMGHVPRSCKVTCIGELTRQAVPGDICTLDAVFLPQRVAESGYRAMKAGLVSTTYLHAQHIFVHKKSFDIKSEMRTEEEKMELDAEILAIQTTDDPIGKLATSIAPEIFGHDDVKRSLLLQLVGGCTRSLPDGMRIRGDINICLMGDPGVAKSQLLKHVASIAPRGVYTTGKGSSGVGLTAAVTKDMTTGEMALEGGALVLADRGICCIDEFDKMDEADRTAIHEVMEQQTVSIAKAGIVATLNARAAVLAAANPLYSRYNRSKSLSENINLPNSLLSRFDLMFLILDVADVEKDVALARHVTYVHRNEGLAEKETNLAADIVSPEILREYISRARQYHPVMPPEVAPYVVEAYVNLRLKDRPGSARRRKHNDQTAMTARQLLSILRLSQALARLRFSDYVAREDVDEAIRLTHMSKASLEDQNNDSRKRGRTEDPTSRIFHIIRDYAKSSGLDEVELRLMEAMVLRKGFTAQQLQACLNEYESLEILHVNDARTHVYLVDTQQ